MAGQSSKRRQCPQCGFVIPCNDDLPANHFFRPWHVRGKKDVKAYVESLGKEAKEWLLALYVDDALHLLAVDTVARGNLSNCRVPFAHILCRGHSLKAAGFILVHNHPSGDATPSDSDIRTTVRLARASRELDVPLIDHLVIAGDEMNSVGLW